MKKIVNLFLVLFPVLVLSQTVTQNYIKTVSYKVASQTAIPNPTITQATSNITYFDGLGRPMQQVAHQQSGSGKDIITPIEYDAFGRQIKDYLPYVSTQTNAAFIDPATLVSNTIAQYQTKYGSTNSNPFSEKKLESSPLNRVLKQAAPGADWAMNAGHEIKLDYQTNTATEVKLYKATTTWNASTGLYNIAFSDGGNYGVNQLYKTITYDENSAASPTESNGSTVEFKNKEGQVVLKRTYESSTKHDTYYVYDNYGNLTYVLPPLFTNASGQLDGLCYQYRYDHRNRLVEKKLPGKQWEFIVYDKLDRPVATGPAFSPFSDSSAGAVGWMITKYDVFNRPVYTGWEQSTTVNSAGRHAKQTAMNGLTVISETKQTTARTIGTITGGLYYTNTVLPTTFELLTVNYYDDYVFQAFTPAIAYTAPVAYNNTTLKPKGLATGSWTRALKTVASTIGESSYVLYDAKARPVRTFSTNHLGGSTQIDNTLNAFSGQLLATETRHKRLTGDAVLYLKDTFTYTAQDRLQTHIHKIGTAGVEQLIVKNEYDELGQLIVKKVGGTNIIGSSSLQKGDYAYNIRGWLTGINNDATNNLVLNTTEKDLFGFKINYNTIKNEVGYTGKELYNGNISETYWRTASDNVQRKYGYKYDNLNRLKESIFQKPGNVAPVPKSYDENLSYDKNGNILNLTRNGDIEGALPANIIDNLVYTYATNTNKLLNVLDNSNNSSGFKDGNKIGDDYSYDANGNLITDKNKNITAIVYNHLNLPTKITFGTTGTIEYIYNATGQKLEKIVTQGTTITSTNYLGGYQYTKPHLGTWALQFFPTAEGYVKNTVVNGANTYSYVFNYTDHLGNVRLSYSDVDKNGTIATTEILDESHYYPFGLKHSGYNDRLVTDYKYKYNKKEFQDEMGLNMYDYGARSYDPALGRWMTIDPLAENSRRWTPYNYAYDNPVCFVDPDGRQAVYNWTGKNKGQYTDNGKVVDFNEALASYGINSGSNSSKDIVVTADDGTTLFTLDDGKKEITKMTAKELYKKGTQWFEPLADNYMPLKSISKGASSNKLRHFTKGQIESFSNIDRWMSSYRTGGSGDWKASKAGANGFLLVTIEGMPYWADAVGQIPFATNKSKDEKAKGWDNYTSTVTTVRTGQEFGDGSIFGGVSDFSNSYDNYMILRGALYGTENRDITKPITKEEAAKYGF